MSITLQNPTTSLTDPAIPAVHEISPRRAGRARWPIFGIVGGIAGFVSVGLGIADLDDDVVATGAGAVDHLKQGNYYASFLIGLVSVACLFFAATGWKRWAEHRAPRDLAARTIGNALMATATINIIFVCLAGSMALYLKGGSDEGLISNEGIFVNWTLLDFGQLLGWWGAVVAAICVVTLSLRRNRVLPRWMGILSIVTMAPALGLAVAIGLPGFVGLTMPIWLVVISIGLVFSRTAEA